MSFWKVILDRSPWQTIERFGAPVGHPSWIEPPKIPYRPIQVSSREMDRIPAETIMEICKHLGFRSRTCLSRTCHGMRTIVDEVPAYRETRKDAPDILKTLG
ncbi:hypothetical protein PT974_12064 [Cladobotryum mycophilum]|uniref:F-box domain-containing protein n=1 Tax=Cladobotryum mycophilum TaxID=491253 RepID=A0ABR0S738_9HYPO